MGSIVPAKSSGSRSSKFRGFFPRCFTFVLTEKHRHGNRASDDTGVYPTSWWNARHHEPIPIHQRATGAPHPSSSIPSRFLFLSRLSPSSLARLDTCSESVRHETREPSDGSDYLCANDSRWNLAEIAINAAALQTPLPNCHIAPTPDNHGDVMHESDKNSRQSGKNRHERTKIVRGGNTNLRSL